jgi:hypothetical protein
MYIHYICNASWSAKHYSSPHKGIGRPPCRDPYGTRQVHTEEYLCMLSYAVNLSVTFACRAFQANLSCPQVRARTAPTSSAHSHAVSFTRGCFG